MLHALRKNLGIRHSPDLRAARNTRGAPPLTRGPYQPAPQAVRHSLYILTACRWLYARWTRSALRLSQAPPFAPLFAHGTQCGLRRAGSGRDHATRRPHASPFGMVDLGLLSGLHSDESARASRAGEAPGREGDDCRFETAAEVPGVRPLVGSLDQAGAEITQAAELRLACGPRSSGARVSPAQ